MHIVEFTVAGRIVKSLTEGALRYSELKASTGLSDAGLSKKLKELLGLGIITQHGDHYVLDAEHFQETLRAEKRYIARAIAYEISKNPKVMAVILFGSVARRMTADGGDIDLLVVAEESGMDQLAISHDAFRRFGVAVDIVDITFKELLNWFSEKPSLLFGILGGYEVLFDIGWFKHLFNLLEKEVLKDWVFLKREKLWVKKELSPYILKRRKST